MENNDSLEQKIKELEKLLQESRVRNKYLSDLVQSLEKKIENRAGMNEAYMEVIEKMIGELK